MIVAQIEIGIEQTARAAVVAFVFINKLLTIFCHAPLAMARIFVFEQFAFVFGNVVGAYI